MKLHVIRHEGSLYIKNKTWKCVIITDFTDVFRSLIKRVSRPDVQISSVDICSFYGKEFFNDSSSDWSFRNDHLTSVHKIDGCNKYQSFHRDLKTLKNWYCKKTINLRTSKGNSVIKHDYCNEIDLTVLMDSSFISSCLISLMSLTTNEDRISIYGITRFLTT